MFKSLVIKMRKCIRHFRRNYSKIIKIEKIWAASRCAFWKILSRIFPYWIHETLVYIKEVRKKKILIFLFYKMAKSVVYIMH